MHYIAFIFVSVHCCILLTEFVTYTQFVITPQVENTFINSHAVIQCPVPLCHPCNLVFQCPVLQIQSTPKYFSHMVTERAEQFYPELC